MAVIGVILAVIGLLLVAALMVLVVVLAGQGAEGVVILLDTYVLPYLGEAIALAVLALLK